MSEDFVYKKAGIWSEKQRKFIEKGDYDMEDGELMNRFQSIANDEKKSVYIVREFIVVDSEYQDQAPSKSAKDWFVKEFKPE